jgi:putative ATP-binding cassette transporter
LSPGELQRIAIARLIVHKPDWVFMDESTSSLDLAHEKEVYQLLKERLPHCTVISVGHRPSLDDYHDEEIDLSAYAVG